MCTFFKNNGYPSHVINSALKRITNISRPHALKVKNKSRNNERIPLTLTYHPLSLPVKKIIYDNFKILQDDQNTKNIFTAPPLMAFRRDTNLREILVKSRLPKEDNAPGTSACGRSNCRTCHYINPDTTISTSRSNFTVHHSFTCSSTCLIYCIKCTRCEMLYIGETCRQINNRFGEHLRNVEHKVHENKERADNADSNVSRHFNLSGHSKSDMSILGLIMAPNCNKKRKTLEKLLIFKLGTLFPNGLNKQFSFS